MFDFLKNDTKDLKNYLIQMEIYLNEWYDDEEDYDYEDIAKSIRYLMIEIKSIVESWDE